MKIKANLQSKIFIQIIITILLVFILLGSFIGSNQRKLTKTQIEDYVKTNTFTNAEKLKLTFEEHFKFTEILSSIVADCYLEDSNVFVKKFVKNQLTKNTLYKAIWILWDENYLNMPGKGTHGWILSEANQSNKDLQYDKNIVSFYEVFGSIAQSNTRSYSNPYKFGDELFINLSSPIFVKGRKKIGFAGVTIPLSFLNEFIEKNNVYKQGFLTVISNNGMFIGHSNSTFIGKTFEENFPLESMHIAVSDSVAKGKTFLLETQFQGQTYYSYFAPTYFNNCAKAMSVEVTIPIDKMMLEANELIKQFIIAGVIAMLVLLLLTWTLSKKIITPIRRVTTILQKLSLGNTKKIKELNYKGHDELGEMALSLNKFVKGIKDTKKFALEIGKGNLEEEYTPLSDEDQLGKSLLDMRNTLKQNREDEVLRKEEAQTKNWINIGVAKFSEILRQDNNNLQKLSTNFISNLVDYLNINQAALFVIDDEITDDLEIDQTKDEGSYFRLVSAVAYGTEKYMHKKVKMGEGLVGRCAYERKTIFLTEVPNDYYTITSGLGTANPNCILLIPCIFNGNVFSVLEMASFSVFKKYEIEFVEQIAESVASTISTTQINERTTKLLRNSQLQRDELISQEEELRQNLEEMEATKEDIQRKAEENENMKNRLNEQKDLMKYLLENINEQVYFKDKDGKYLYASESLLAKMGINDVDDLIGKSDFDFFEKNIAEEIANQEKNIIETQNGFKNREIEQKNQKGEKEILQISKSPILNKDNKLIGLVSISKNITALKKTEKQLHNKKQELNDFLDILKETAYTVEYDSNALILDINIPLVSLLNIESKEIVGKKYAYEFDMNEMEKEEYKKFWKDLTNGIPKQRVNFIQLGQQKIWLSETYIPLFNEDKEIEKILKIAFDVTSHIK